MLHLGVVLPFTFYFLAAEKETFASKHTVMICFWNSGYVRNVELTFFFLNGLFLATSGGDKARGPFVGVEVTAVKSGGEGV